MAHISLFGKSIKIFPCPAVFICRTSCRLYAKGTFSSIPIHFLISSQLDDRVQEFYLENFGKAATAAMMTHLRRELAHAIWMLLMDDEFMHAYIHGLVFCLVDGILRVFFPRFLTYSADYPEK